MKPFVKLGIVSAILLMIQFQRVSSQIPAACSDARSLENSICCPDTGDGVCGLVSGRGLCVSLNQPGYSNESTDVRTNWPHYFTQVCQCNGNYGGYDCGRCRFGYYGPDCSQKQVLPRRPIHEYTDEEWNEFIQIIRMSKTYQSDYVVILEESRPGTSNLTISNISIYNMFVWLHHFAGKDSDAPGIPREEGVFRDYAHFGPAFITWHRHLNIWFEYEIQWMLQRMGRADYHTYRSPYFDWRREIQEGSGVKFQDILVENRFGFTNYSTDFPIVSGQLVEGWQSVCARMLRRVCNPNILTGPIQRCPVPDRCRSDNPDWPTLERINRAISFETFDVAPWNDISSDGFRSFVDFEIGSDPDACRNDRMCMCAGDINCTDPAIAAGSPVITLYSRIHTTLHFVAGVGDFKTFSYIDPSLHGSMLDVASSPNDPLFILHHTAVDCVFEEWLKRHPDGEYPDSPDVPQGHLRDGYMVPFYPLFTNNDMFKPAENFGYSCSLPDLESKANALSPVTWCTVIITATLGLLTALCL